jgi:hypothetical protein
MSTPFVLNRADGPATACDGKSEGTVTEKLRGDLETNDPAWWCCGAVTRDQRLADRRDISRPSSDLRRD